MSHSYRCSPVRGLLIGLIGLALAACDTPDGGSSQRPASMLEPVVDDRAVAAAVKAALRADSSFALDAFEVTATDGVVELGGAVDDQAQIDRAMALAFMVPGVRSIRNRARLADPPLAAMTHADDRRITNHVMTGLKADTRISQFGIFVMTVRGDVLLSGMVDQQTQIDHAIKVARAVNGVRGVRHVMHIRKPGAAEAAARADTAPAATLRATAYRESAAIR